MSSVVILRVWLVFYVKCLNSECLDTEWVSWCWVPWCRVLLYCDMFFLILSVVVLRVFILSVINESPYAECWSSKRRYDYYFNAIMLYKASLCDSCLAGHKLNLWVQRNVSPHPRLLSSRHAMQCMGAFHPKVGGILDLVCLLHLALLRNP